VFWLNAYGNDGVQTALSPEQREAQRTDQVRRMAERLGVVTHGMTEEQVDGALARKIDTGGKNCLWVVDDVPDGLDGEALRLWFAPHARARTLITLTKGIDLSVLERDEAYQLSVPADRDEKAQAGLLATDLGYHAAQGDLAGARKL
jgi:hypothetical protein